MIRHIALMQFVGGTTSGAIDAIDQGLGLLPESIEQIESYMFGRDLGISPRTWDYAVVAEFASIEDFGIYATHPDHLLVIETAITPVLSNISRVQFTVSG